MSTVAAFTSFWIDAVTTPGTSWTTTQPRLRMARKMAWWACADGSMPGGPASGTWFKLRTGARLAPQAATNSAAPRRNARDAWPEGRFDVVSIGRRLHEDLRPRQPYGSYFRRRFSSSLYASVSFWARSLAARCFSGD